MTRVAAFDCGTNSLRLLIADLDVESGTSEDVVREMRIVRLGQGVDRTGRIADASLQRVFSAVEDYMEQVKEHDVSAIRFCATSAARDAENADEFVRGIRERVGVDPDVLDGAEEARVSFAGATRSLPPLPEPMLVCDIGGGSTELILGDADGNVRAAESLDIGSVRLNERHLAGDPPTDEEVEAAVADIDAALDGCSVDPADAGAVIGVAGTVTTLAAAVLDLPTYDSTLIHHTVLRPDAVQGAVNRLLTMMVEQRKALPYMHPGRADVIGAGGLILDRILRRTTVNSMLVSEHDILDGIAWSLAIADHPGRWERLKWPPSTRASPTPTGEPQPSGGERGRGSHRSSPRSNESEIGFENREDYKPGPKRPAFFVLRRTVREFLDDGGTDLAAALTYYSVLAIFPALIALMALRRGLRADAGVDRRDHGDRGAAGHRRHQAADGSRTP